VPPDTLHPQESGYVWIMTLDVALDLSPPVKAAMTEKPNATERETKTPREEAHDIILGILEKKPATQGVDGAPITGPARIDMNQLAAWIKSGFREYATICGSWEGEIHRRIRIQILKYAKEFGRILRGEMEMSEEDDLLMLRKDLYVLMNAGCPAAGLVELMLACTSDYGVTIPDLLWRANYLDEHGYSHKNLGFPTEPQPSFSEHWAMVRGFLHGVASKDESVAKALPGLLNGKMSDVLRFRLHCTPTLQRVKRGIPLSIQFMQQKCDQAQTSHHLACFYVFLKRFGYGYDTEAQLLRAMQHVRRKVPPVADYLQTRGKHKFTMGAVQRRVGRFFEDHRESEHEMRQKIRQYLSRNSDRYRTLLDMP
jgi:hypothetical protein